MYTMDQVQDMLTKVKNDPKLKTAILKQFGKGHMDQNAIADVISNGWVDRFERYDSAVCDNFIIAYEKCTGKNLDESTLKDYELELEFTITFNKKLDFSELQSVVYYMNSYFGSSNTVSGDVLGLNTCTTIPGHEVIEPNDVDFDRQSIYLLLYDKFKGQIVWDQDGLGRSFYEFEGAPDSEEDYVKSIKAIVASTPECDLSVKDVNVEWVGSSLTDKLDDIAEHEAIGEYEAHAVNAAKSILEGANIRKTLLN